MIIAVVTVLCYLVGAVTFLSGLILTRQDLIILWIGTVISGALFQAIYLAVGHLKEIKEALQKMAANSHLVKGHINLIQAGILQESHQADQSTSSRENQEEHEKKLSWEVIVFGIFFVILITVFIPSFLSG